MVWWAWCILGVVLLGVELLALDAQFYLVFAGLAALLVGLLGFLGIELPVTLQWLAFAVLAIVSMFTLRRQIYSKLMAKPLGTVSGYVDQPILVTQDLAPGKSCRLEYRGSGWTALNVGEQTIAAGATARIESIEGLTLKVRAS
jgi:hypothetical protein